MLVIRWFTVLENSPHGNKDCDSIEENQYNGDTSLSDTEVPLSDSSTIESETECENVEKYNLITRGCRLRPRKRTNIYIANSTLFTENPSCLSGIKGCSRSGSYKNKRQNSSGTHVSYRKAMLGKVLLPILREKTDTPVNIPEKSGRKRSRKGKAQKTTDFMAANATTNMLSQNFYPSSHYSQQSSSFTRFVNKSAKMRAKYQRMSLKKLGLRYKRKAMLCKIVLPILTVKRGFVSHSKTIPKKGRWKSNGNFPPILAITKKRGRKNKNGGRGRKIINSRFTGINKNGIKKKIRRRIKYSPSTSPERDESAEIKKKRGRPRTRASPLASPSQNEENRRSEQKNKVVKSSLLRYELFRHYSNNSNSSLGKFNFNSAAYNNNSQADKSQLNESVNSNESLTSNQELYRTRSKESTKSSGTSIEAKHKAATYEENNCDSDSTEYKNDDDSDTVTNRSISEEETSIMYLSDETQVSTDTLFSSTQGSKDVVENNMQLRNDDVTNGERTPFQNIAQTRSDPENIDMFSNNAVMFGENN